ncbi:rhomboid family intramembrane serine protease [Pseudaestuariivita atlantica]|uniref:rhomboid family intramembrane serine protease n=1 Tax=Pseudaestuariivita atlantica TaxID=1317121 RepID=UPI000AC2BBE7|nr:rhomboid family intramembrane serine protease [Pseudaestuariivita atlantica]
MRLERFVWIAALLVAIWGFEAVNLISGYALNPRLGLIPRHVAGLDGVLFMPLLHGSVAHAAANTAPLAVLGAVVVLTAHRDALLATAIIVLGGGLAVWLFAGKALHVGASGLIFGWFGFLIARGVVERRAVPLIAAIGVAVIYGTMVWGVLPGQEGISWEAHLFGALAGLAAAILLRRRA